MKSASVWSHQPPLSPGVPEDVGCPSSGSAVYWNRFVPVVYTREITLQSNISLNLFFDVGYVWIYFLFILKTQTPMTVNLTQTSELPTVIDVEFQV